MQRAHDAEPDPGDWRVPRALAGLGALLVIGLLAVRVHNFGATGLLPHPLADAFILAVEVTFLPLAALALCGHRPRIRVFLSVVTACGLLGGFVGFAIGTVLGFTDGGNLGPVVGLFWTGPLGYLAGLLAGPLLALTPMRRPLSSVLPFLKRELLDA